MYYVPFCLLVADLGWSHIGADELHAFKLLFIDRFHLFISHVSTSHAAASRVIRWDGHRFIPLRFAFVFHISTYLIYEHVTTTNSNSNFPIIKMNSILNMRWQFNALAMAMALAFSVHCVTHTIMPCLPAARKYHNMYCDVELRARGETELWNMYFFLGCKMILIVVILSC